MAKNHLETVAPSHIAGHPGTIWTQGTLAWGTIEYYAYLDHMVGLFGDISEEW